MVAGDKFHTVIDDEIERAKAVIVLWSPRSVVSDWVLGEAQTARDLNKLIPIKIADCKLPIPYRAIHTPEIYKTKGELDQLAKLLSEKFDSRSSNARAGEPAPSPQEISISASSANTFFKDMRAQNRAYSEEVRLLTADKSLSFMDRSKRSLGLLLKYPAVALGLWVVLLVVVTYSDISAGKRSDELIQDLASGIIGLPALYLYLRYRYRR